MRTKRLAFVVALAAVGSLLPAAAQAQSEDPAALTGTWKRDGETPRLIRLDVDPQTSELVGKMLNPPADDQGKPYGVEIRLKLTGNKLEGRVTWSEDNPAKATPGQPDKFTCDTTWDLTVEGSDKLVGKVEWISWNNRGEVDSRGFEDHTFERQKSTSLGTRAGTAPENVDAGQPIEAPALAGTWKAPQGWAVTFKPAEGGFSLERVKGEGEFPTGIRLANTANVLKGTAKWADGVETAVELKLSATGKLEGRAERVEAENKTWSPWSLERLTRIDAAADAAAGEPPALAAGPAGAALALDLKRDDGLYLKLTAKDGGAYEGELVSKVEGLRAKVELATGADGKLAGKATFTVDGAPVEAHWELAPQADGSVEARCEWLDWDPATKTVAARGFAVRKFKALRKTG